METTAQLKQRPYIAYGPGGSSRIRAVMEVHSEASSALLVLMDLLNDDSPGFPAGLPPEVVVAASGAWEAYLHAGGHEHLESLRQDVRHAV